MYGVIVVPTTATSSSSERGVERRDVRRDHRVEHRAPVLGGEHRRDRVGEEHDHHQQEHALDDR